MTITRDVVTDLLPLYVAGEASADTRAIVEAYIRVDPEVAAQVAALGEVGAALGAGASRDAVGHGVGREAGLAALGATKRLLRRRTWLMAAAIFCSGLPFTVAGGSDGIRFFMLRDAPGAAVLLLAGAVILWGLFALTARRLRVSGL